MAKDHRIHRGPAELLNAGAWLAIPNEYVDQLLPAMKASEFAVLLVVKRWTHGFGQASRTMSQTMIQERTGLSRSGVRKALKALQEAGHIKKVRETNHLRACEWALNEDYGKDAERVTEEPSVGYSETHSGPLSNPPSIKHTSEIQQENTYDVVDEPEAEQSETASILERVNRIKMACGWRHEQRDRVLEVAATRDGHGIPWLDRWLTWIERGDKSKIKSLPGFTYSAMVAGEEPPGFANGHYAPQKPGEVVALGAPEDYKTGPVHARSDQWTERLRKARAARAVAEATG